MVLLTGASLARRLRHPVSDFLMVSSHIVDDLPGYQVLLGWELAGTDSRYRR